MNNNTHENFSIWVINTRMAVRGSSGRRGSEDENETASESSATTIKAGGKEKSKRESAWEMFSSLLREEGVFSLWQGVIPALILVSNPSIQYMV